MSNQSKTPRFLLWIVILLMLPVLALPVLLSKTPEDFKMFLWFYPVYVLTTGYLAYQCYAQRREMTYILLTLLMFSHVAVWLLPDAI
ncbi:MAG: hypothetical protein IJN66_05210 [Muribaculaceae bacterium]|nr:hypothetical protein [Muribaculaceae bacterium]